MSDAEAKPEFPKMDREAFEAWYWAEHANAGAGGNDHSDVANFGACREHDLGLCTSYAQLPVERQAMLRDLVAEVVMYNRVFVDFRVAPDKFRAVFDAMRSYPQLLIAARGPLAVVMVMPVPEPTKETSGPPVHWNN